MGENNDVAKTYICHSRKINLHSNRAAQAYALIYVYRERQKITGNISYLSYPYNQAKLRAKRIPTSESVKFYDRCVE